MSPNDAGAPAFRFGPAIEPGGVRFRLWAPAAEAVAVILAPDTGAETRHPLAPQGDGWFEALVAEAGPGTDYLFDTGHDLRVPDPASRFQAADALGPSRVIDPDDHVWRETGWAGRPWAETVIYELHVGTFSPEGTFDGVRERLDHLVDLGVTAIELMPVADFPGARNWGYDGVLPFAPDSAYGTPQDLKRLIDAAHGRGLMVFLDVVYNHFGPEGNFLHAYAPAFFTDRHETPWGSAIDFSRPAVRRFFVENVLYWLDEYRFDGLRFDAVHAILDDEPTHILEEIATTARATIDPARHIHLVLENDANEARRLRPGPEGGPGRSTYEAQWNDDWHHVAHVLLTGESGGYYGDYADAPRDRMIRAMGQGFVYQGEPSPHRGGAARGEPSADLPPTAFVDFVQNHDQIGNRAFGDRLTTLAEPRALEAMTALLLLAPSPPLLFMGEEWGTRRPFLFFCDFHDALADAVREGRRREFESFPDFADPKAREAIPDPNDPATAEASRLDWAERDAPEHARRLGLTRALLGLRAREVVPLIPGLGRPTVAPLGETGLRGDWPHATAGGLTVVCNPSPAPVALDVLIEGRPLHASDPEADVSGAADSAIPGWTTIWWRRPPGSVAP
ncbi:MAG: malto-oligosyltrehalose trehalohydrolase [Azospirillaceae bacterium]